MELLNLLLEGHEEESLVTLGNHEFDYGVPELTQRIKDSTFPWLAGNVLWQNGSPFTGSPQTRILEFGGFKAGFFSLLTLETPHISKTDDSIRFIPILPAAKEMIAELKEQGADVIVCLTHLRPQEEESLRREFPEITLQFGGHTHEPYSYEDDRSLMIRTGQNAERLARATLTLNEDESSTITTSFSWDFVENKHVPADPVIAQKVQEIKKSLDKFDKILIGTMGMACDSRSSTLRTRETPFGNFLADALLDRFNTDIALFCGGSIRGEKYFQEGDPVSIKTILDEHPHNHLVVSMQVSGETILKALEHSIVEAPTATGRFLHVAGMRFAYDTQKPPYARVNVEDVFIRSKPIDLSKTYTLTTLDFFVNGIEGFTMFKNAPMDFTPEHGLEFTSLVIDYIKKQPLIKSQVEGRVVALSSQSEL